MLTMLDPRAARAQAIYERLDDQRFAAQSINLALDALDAWQEQTKRPTITPSRDSNGRDVPVRDYFRQTCPRQFRECKNVGLAIKIFFSEMDAEFGNVKVKRTPGWR